MSDPAPFHELIARVRAGDPEAAAELVRQYEPAVRRAVRFRLANARLGRLLDSVDICQEVLGSFFVRAALGQYDLDTPDRLVTLLVGMAHHKLSNQLVQQRAQRRDYRRVADGGVEDLGLAHAGASPSSQVAAKELLDKVRQRLPTGAREVLELRAQGHDWAEVAVRLGGSAEALRKKFERAIERVARQLGLDS